MRKTCFHKYHNNSIKPWGEGGLFKTLTSREGLIREGGLIQKSTALLEGWIGSARKIGKEELDKMVVKLNYVKLDIGMIMQEVF